MYIYMYHMDVGYQQRSEESIGSLGLELWTVMNYHVDAGTRPGSSARAENPTPK